MLRSKLEFLFGALSVLLVVTAAGQAAPIVTVTPSLGPDYLPAPGSPSYAGFSANALTALEAGANSQGTPNTPQFFNRVTNIHPKDVLVGVAPSWRGEANPAAPFDNEIGTVLYFGLHIVSDSYFSMWAVTYSENAFGVPYSFAFNGESYDDYAGDMVGIDYVDGIKGNGNDITYTTGPGSVNINELIFVGIGFSFDASGYPGTPQEQLDGAAADVPIPGTIRGGYFLVNGGVSYGFAEVTTVPEPATILLSLAGLAGLAMFRRLRKQN